jgi:hypothetical protein
MRNFPRFLRVVLLPVAVLAMVAGSSASASAATLPVAKSVTVVVNAAPASIVAKIHINSMSW